MYSTVVRRERVLGTSGSYHYNYHYDNKQSGGAVLSRSISVTPVTYQRYTSLTPQRTLAYTDFGKVANVLMMGPESTYDDIREAFMIIDSDHSGQIDFQELARVIPAIIPDANLSTLRAAVRRFDKNFDDKLNLTEFVTLITSGVARNVFEGALFV
ncbi:unnamed protein product [Didymodactylos carnosus]|uniref:EF-hand domain-containing protein n=1 Tax=Didymodactylos carnosus TaxID=1234261 RepID=A0A815ZUE8_9BILA|nr:unnamed protein product [Didymodactylos carnosus]CAF4461242.1 unnamed protein product [Didymodactylos carnosus]